MGTPKAALLECGLVNLMLTEMLSAFALRLVLQRCLVKPMETYLAPTKESQSVKMMDFGLVSSCKEYNQAYKVRLLRQGVAKGQFGAVTLTFVGNPDGAGDGRLDVEGVLS